MFLLLGLILALQSQQSIKLRRFEILRVDPAGMNRLPPSLRAIFADPVPDAEPVASLNEAEMRAGFTPRLPKSATPLQLGVTDPVHADARIELEALNQALRDGTVTDVTVPQDWEAVTIAIERGRGVLADYGDFVIVQAPPLTLNNTFGFSGRPVRRGSVPRCGDRRTRCPEASPEVRRQSRGVFSDPDPL